MDCETELNDIIKRCQEKGINCIAVSDHDATEGALKMKALAPFPVVVAEEILTPNGEIMGMFLKEHIPSGISIEEAIAQIKAQGGLVCLPHPFDPFRGLRVDTPKLEALVAQIDIIEEFNARLPLLRYANKARSFAQKHGKPVTAGSDAHHPSEIGYTYVEMPEFNGRDDFTQALRQGKIHRRRSNFLVHFSSTWTKLKRAF